MQDPTRSEFKENLIGKIQSFGTHSESPPSKDDNLMFFMEFQKIQAKGQEICHKL